MTPFTKTLITLVALVGATAAFAAGDQIRQKDQLRDGSCIELGTDGTSPDCLLLTDRDQTMDQVKDRIGDQDRLQLKDGSCLDGDGIPDLDGDGAKVQTRTRTQAENGGHGNARSGH